MKVVDSTLVLDCEQLRDITLNDTDLMRELVSALIDDTTQQVHRLAEAVRDHDRNGCMRIAHSCKGACANIGANRAAALFRKLEQNASSEAFEKCGEMLGYLSSEIAMLQKESVELLSGADFSKTA